MEGIQTNAVKEDEYVLPPKQPKKEKEPEPMPSPEPRIQVLDSRETPGFKYSAAANDEEGDVPRFRRALENPNKRRSCSLYIQTDPLFWRHVRDQV